MILISNLFLNHFLEGQGTLKEKSEVTRTLGLYTTSDTTLFEPQLKNTREQSRQGCT